MRSFGLCAILVALAMVAPPSPERSADEALWAAGLLLLFALVSQNICTRLRLPPLTAWVLAGLLLGPTALAAVDARLPVLGLAGAVAAVWAGLLVGLAATWPAERRSWRLPAIVAASTVATCATLAIVVGLVGGLPWPVAFVFAAVASMWGPVVSDFWRSRETQVIALFGSLVALVLLCVPLVAGGAGQGWVARLLLSIAGSGLVAEAAWRLGVLRRRDTTLLAVGAGTLLAAFAAVHLGLPGLPMGLAAGLVLAAREGTGRQLGHLLAPARSLAILAFAGLLVASIDAVPLLTPSVPGLYEIVVVQLLVLFVARGIGPALWYPLPSSGEFSRRSGWLLLPKGLIAAELVFGGGGLTRLLAPEHAHLLRSVVLADLLVYGVVLGALAALVPPRREPEATAA